MTESHTQFTARFHCAALGPDDLAVRHLEGIERMSQLFEFDLTLQTTFDGVLDFGQIDQMLVAVSSISFGAEEEHKRFGVLSSVELVGPAEMGPTVYRVRLVPRMYWATQNVGSYVFQDMSIPEIIKDVLSELQLSEGTDFEFRLTGNYPKLEYVVQYQETDFNFICRWMEKEGIFFFFEHGECDKIVFSDSNAVFENLDGHASFPFDPRGVVDASESITQLSRTARPVYEKVILKDYNYRTPSVMLRAEVPTEGGGQGYYLWYGDHFKDVGQGTRYARIRGQEFATQRYVYHGTSHVRGLKAGVRFSLEGHVIGDFDAEYIVTEVRHTAAQEVLAGNDGDQGYSNSFVVIPSRTPYRAPRLTPQPRIYGIIQGRVDGPAGMGAAAPIDDHGRYKVALPFDVSGQNEGRASRWIRRAQPSAGANYGFHMPLHIGTEVLLAHIDGDPDRPIIVGAVPNAETMSPVTNANPTQSTISTRSGIVISMDDEAP